MASIFTFDPNPPRVSSPWSPTATTADSHATPNGAGRGGLNIPRGIRHDSPLTRLEAEPQEGPTEYKLHLLLRPRRSFVSMTTPQRISGSCRSNAVSITSRSASESNLNGGSPPPATSSTGKQHRLEQLTTQLLWRLQQSSPYHSTASYTQILPVLPDAAGELRPPTRPSRLLPGLEDSKGALYEIGVADDGTFVGLAQDEMEESLNNLRAMAASLGCVVEILRQVQVGTCEWFEVEPTSTEDDPQMATKSSTLWVVEAFIKPDMDSWRHDLSAEDAPHSTPEMKPLRTFTEDQPSADTATSSTEQLRLSLTGSTMSGKSSLLGTLSTATLDNGRGKSRLSLLRHRHEIASGMTSSVTQELIGYCDLKEEDGSVESSQVINYASGNVSSWTDIHASSQPGRLVFLSDSAGHPRYRRTTVRGLIGWAPHWTVLCIPADNTEDTAGRSGSTPPPQELLGPAAADVDLSDTHLQLCLDLERPLVVVITKLDLASNNGLRQTLSRLLSTLKSAGRHPLMLPVTKQLTSELDLSDIPGVELNKMHDKLGTLNEDPIGVVPIILTSAVNGTGIGSLHALIHELPIPATPIPQPGIDALYHIEDVYGSSSGQPSQVTVLSGHLEHGTISVGDELLVGPFQEDSLAAADTNRSQIGTHERMHLTTSRSYPGVLTGPEPQSPRPAPTNEWRRVKVVSIRNLRLPVRTLQTGQVGTMGLKSISEPLQTPHLIRLRKGMVLASSQPRVKARRGFTARFSRHQVRDVLVGSVVVVYFASVRASAKLLTIAVEEEDDEHSPSTDSGGEEGGFSFGFEGDGDEEENVEDGRPTLATFRFVASKEFVELGAQVLMMPGGGPGLFCGTGRGEKGVAGLDGFVGTIVDAFE